MSKKIYIPGRIQNAAVDNEGNRLPVTGAEDIDAGEGKSQQYVNSEVNKALILHQHEIDALDSQNYVTVNYYLALPTIGEIDTIYRVSSYDGTQMDTTKYAEYAWNGSNYILLSVKSQVGEVFNISQYRAVGGTLATFDDLADALDDGDNVPVGLRSGGMSVKFVRSSDNKYVQYRCMAQNFTTDVTQWQGVDDEPKINSNNLVDSKGIIFKLNAYSNNNIAGTIGKNLLNPNAVGKVDGFYCDISNGNLVANAEMSIYPVKVKPNTTYLLCNKDAGGIQGMRSFFTEDGKFISGIWDDAVFTTPANCAWVLYSAGLNVSENQIQEGTDFSFEYYKNAISEKQILESAFDLAPTENSKKLLKSGAIFNAEKKFPKLSSGKNLYNKNSAVINKFVLYTDGSINSVEGYQYVQIPVTPETQYTISGAGDGIHVVFFNTDTVATSNYISGTLEFGTSTITTPQGCVMMTVSNNIQSSDTAQVEVGSTASSYSEFGEYISSSYFEKESIPQDRIDGYTEHLNLVVDINGGGDFTSILDAIRYMASRGKGTILVKSGTYDLEAEYKATFGNSFFEDYSGIYGRGGDDIGYYLRPGMNLIGEGMVRLVFQYAGDNDYVHQSFSIINTTCNNRVENLTLVSDNIGHCRYHIHDDFAYDSPSYTGTNIFKNLMFEGATRYTASMGCGMGVANTYIIENCYFDATTPSTSISYHNSLGGANAMNKLFISNCKGPGRCIVLPLGSSTNITKCVINNCEFGEIVKEMHPQGTVDNMELIKFNNVETNS